MDEKVYPKKIKCELYNDSMQGWKCYPIQKAQLIIADVPYNVGNNFYGSNPMWYVGGDNKNGESKLAGKAAFASDFNFNLFEYFHFCSRLMKKDDTKPASRGRSTNSPCMIVFCSFEQTHTLIQAAAKNGFPKYIPLVFIKNYSPQVLKANMRVVGATEYALLFYRDRLPKFRNGLKVDENGKNITGTGHMVFNWFKWEKDGKDIPKIHPAQKPVNLLKRLIETFTDPYDVVIDPCFGSGSTARACMELNRNFYGFEINKEFYKRAKEEMCILPPKAEDKPKKIIRVAEKKLERETAQMTIFDLMGGNLMISAMLILVTIGTIVVVTDYWIDRIVTRKRVAENQRAWNEYSKGMTKEEKLSVYLTWCELRRVENGWEHYYFPRM